MFAYIVAFEFDKSEYCVVVVALRFPLYVSVSVNASLINLISDTYVDMPDSNGFVYDFNNISQFPRETLVVSIRLIYFAPH